MSDLDGKLVAYADGELDAEAVREIEALVASDPQARQAVEIFRSTASLLRAACGEHVYAAGAEALLPAARPWTQPRPVRRRSVNAWMGTAALAASILGFVGGATWAGWPRDDRSFFLAEVASYHAIYAREDRPLDLMQAEPASEALAWIGQRLRRRLEVPDLTADGLQYSGARLLVAENRHVAQLIYTRAQGLPVGLCITKFPGQAALATEQHGVQRTAAWQDGEFIYILVGEVDDGELRAIATHAARQLATSQG